ncbi:glycosyltransferase family 4 protein [Poseidonocella sp. HB161398]|uniref:glycosyltransferase family 4 protein n=1 Tax=Poseidonocella sp. HB161398 TaxID=2320855 RepID=UPI001109A002|nr:glycosyltransferase family 4 protein [Poseidonocella sp. HB161398]
MKILLTANTSFALANFRAGLIAALKQDGHELVALVPVDDYTPALREAGCTVIELPMDRRGTRPDREAATFLTVARTLREVRPGAVLSYTIKNNLYSGIAARAMGIPFLPNVTGLGTVFSGRSTTTILAQRAYRLAFGRARAVFFQNSEDRARFTGEGLVTEERARLLPGSGVDLGRFAVTPLPGTQQAPVFLLIARLLWEKGIGEYVEAARIVRERYPEAQFRILGALEKPGDAAVPEARLAEWTEEGAVSYLGTARDVRPVIAGADCVVLPSYYREGTPRVLLEAAASGRPVVTTGEPGCRDVVADGKTGYLVTSRDARDLARALLQIADAAPEARQAMGCAGRARMESLYDEKLVITAYRTVLNELSAA